MRRFAITTKSGDVKIGIIAAGNDSELVVRDPEGKEHTIAVAEIAQREMIGSLMPAGLLDHLSPEDLRDLFAYLTGLGKGAVVRDKSFHLVGMILSFWERRAPARLHFPEPGWSPAIPAPCNIRRPARFLKTSAAAAVAGALASPLGLPRGVRRLRPRCGRCASG
jgi:hypothetical protein